MAPSPAAPVIGLAGGIGSGKSAVAGFLRESGCFVTNSDADARELLQEERVREQLIRWWGTAVLDAQGRVNRHAVADIVFRNPTQRERLEALVHPLVEERRREAWAAESARRSVPAFVIDAPLLFEAGLDRLCDAVIFVDAPLKDRLARVAADRGWSEAELIRREKNQLPLETKRQRSDYVVRNDGSLADLRRHVQSALDQILAAHRSAPPRRVRSSDPTSGA